jgi:hypothetical protein
MVIGQVKKKFPLQRYKVTWIIFYEWYKVTYAEAKRWYIYRFVINQDIAFAYIIPDEAGCPKKSRTPKYDVKLKF